MAKNSTKTLNELLEQTRRVRTVFWGRSIDGLGPAALQLLVAVKAAKSVADTTAGALASVIGIAPPAASAELSKLETAGYVSRPKASEQEEPNQADGEDKKVHHLSRITVLTDRGEAAVESVGQKAREYDQ